MSAFMDGVAEDLDAVFLDLDAFGEMHIVKGREISILYDSAELERLKTRQKESAFNDDVHKAEVLFYAKERDIGPSVSVNTLLEIDGRRYFVYQARLVAGLWRILLGRRQL